MSWYVYVLHSNKDGKLYIGCTSDVAERMQRHNSGNVPATLYRRPLTLIHTEQYEKKADAFNRERFLKSLWGARDKKKIRKKYLGG
jgi:putative endonuclease